VTKHLTTNTPKTSNNLWLTLSATFWLAAGGLWLEFALLRTLSFWYANNQVQVAITIALLGVGIGAALSSHFASLRRRDVAAIIGWLTSVSVLIAVLGVARAAYLRPLILLLACLPFVGSGMLFSNLFSRANKQQRFWLYGADLVGAGVACLSAVTLLNITGGVGGMAVSALSMALAASCLWLEQPTHRNLRKIISTALGLGVIIASIFGLNSLTLNLSALSDVKTLKDALTTGSIETTRWDSLARTDLVSDGGRWLLYVDGAAASLIPTGNVSEDVGNMAFVPSLTTPEATVLLIGSGGGLDVALADTAGLTNLTAVELNSSSLTLTAQVSDIYQNSTVYNREGRSFIRYTDQQFDVIFLSHVIASAAERGAFALSEAYLYTQDAFADYWDALSETGHVAIKLYDEATLTRALITALAHLQSTGVSANDALLHTAAFLDSRAGIPILIVQKQPFDRDEAITLAREAEARGFSLLLVPQLLTPPSLESLADNEGSLEEVIAASSLDIRPTRDVRPYFFYFQAGLPPSLRPLLWLALACLLVVVGIILASPRRNVQTSVALTSAGFISLELTILQISRWFIGHPVIGLSAVLGTLLLMGGVGSAMASRLGNMPKRLLGLLITGLLWFVGVAWVAQTDITLSPAWRVVLFCVSVCPLGLLMGGIFPSLLGRLEPQSVTSAWAISGLMSVAGSIAVTVLSFQTGTWGVAVFALLMYAGVFVNDMMRR
jgi:hypothetical protein